MSHALLNNSWNTIEQRMGQGFTPGNVILATHESGHLITILALGRQVERVEIDGKNGAVTWHRLPPPSDSASQRRWFVEESAIALAGGVAEKLLRFLGASDLTAFSLGDNQASIDAIDQTDIRSPEIEPLTRQGLVLATRIVDELQSDIDSIAWSLLRYGRLSAAQVKQYAPLAYGRYERERRTYPAAQPARFSAPAPQRPTGLTHTGRYGYGPGELRYHGNENSRMYRELYGHESRIRR